MSNCRVEVPTAVSARIITKERVTPDGNVSQAVNIGKKRAIAKSVVRAPVEVLIERKGAHSIVEVARVPEVRVPDERVSSNGRVPIAEDVEDHRCGANCRIGIRSGSGEGQRSKKSEYQPNAEFPMPPNS